ncbi:MAG: SMP-30/gluconolactonase/LRE family protein [Verrucomicrobiaceae bacterium]|nr:SMP-30/gluconolactonase/LRE family protein [Verrucomicrobiaceae bacterium]
MLRPLLALSLALAQPLIAADEYPPGPDSKPQPGIAKGTLIKDTYRAASDSVFPGTEREYTLYLPAAFDPAKPTPYMVFQDGVIYQAPTVFDNLIAKKEIPPLVGVFIRPGVVPAANDNALPRFNRSYEYDSVNPSYSQFLIDEFLPAIEAKHGLKLSTDPNHAAISGNSSGGICAFMAAWHRPDRFRRVFTGVGTYVGIHGADQLPVLVRKVEPKPLRVFLQSGTGDNNLYCGDWWMANQMMERSLTWAGYDVNHAWGEGGHNAKHATQIFPDVMRWLWRDWQTNIEVKANPKDDSKWKGYEIIPTGSAWEKVENSLKQPAHHLQVDLSGQITPTANPHPRAVDHTGRKIALPEGGNGQSLCLSPDQTLAYISQKNAHFIHSAQISPSGTLQHAQPYYMLETRDDGTCEASGMSVDTEGRLYVATALGVQVCDQAGRVNYILPTPKQPLDVCFGGKDLSELFIACGDTIYKRPTKAKGVISGQQKPLKPTAPKL